MKPGGALIGRPLELRDMLAVLKQPALKAQV
jgi:hypothetical protein